MTEVTPFMSDIRFRYACIVGAMLLVACGCATAPRSDSGFRVKPAGSVFGPKGSPWTILCMEVRGPERLDRIGQITGTLRRTPSIRSDDIVLMDDPDDVARLYYGVYYRRTDPKTGKRSIPKRLRANIDTIKQLGNRQSGQYYFLTARIVRVPTPDAGHPDWMLSKVDAVYSLQVAAFEPTNEFWDFKLAAAEYCKELRKKGYEAYYHHGPGCSVVTVGAFGADAVIQVADGRRYYSGEVTAMQRDELLKYNRLNGRIYRARNKTYDRLNGRIYRARSDRGEMVRVPSRLVETPSDRDWDTWWQDREPY